MIRVNREELLKALGAVLKSSSPKHGLPILANVLIKPVGKTLQLTGTDLESFAHTTCPFDLTGSASGFTCDAKKLLTVCKGFASDAEIDIDVQDNHLLVKSGRARTKINTLPAEDFPILDAEKTTGSYIIDSHVFKSMLAFVLSSAAKNDARYYLNGVLMEVANNELNLVATDGHRLSFSSMRIFTEAADIQLILPNKFSHILASELPDSDDPLRIEYAPEFCQVILGGNIFGSKTIEGKFPDYQRVIPHNPVWVAECDAAELRKALVRSRSISGDKYFGTLLQFAPGRLSIKSSSQEEEFSDEIDIVYAGDEVNIGFNTDYLLSALNTLTDARAVLNFSDGISSMIVAPADNDTHLHVIMPMRI